MGFLWIWLVTLMAEVMRLGHGGDGGDDGPPPPVGFGHGQHQHDAVPPRRRRGPNKNLGLSKALLNNRNIPLPLQFDTEFTYTIVGDRNDYFVREAGSYTYRHMTLNQPSWDDVSKEEKNALYMHMRSKFNFEAAQIEKEKELQHDGVEAVFRKRYRDRKSYSKSHFKKNGGYADLARARGSKPAEMSHEKWNKAIEWFHDPRHTKASARNTIVREKQTSIHRGGTSSFSSTCFKRDLDRVQSFYHAHTRNGVWDSSVLEEQYNMLVSELQQTTQGEGEGSTPTNPTPMDTIGAFEKVLGARRGHIRGIGRKPPSASSSCHEAQSSQAPTQVSPQTQLGSQLMAQLMSDPTLMSQFYDMMLASKRPPQEGDNEDEGERGDDE